MPPEGRKGKNNASRREDGENMSRNKTSGVKKKLTALGKKRSAPRWADIRKYGLKRARSRRIRIRTKHWRRDKLKV